MMRLARALPITISKSLLPVLREPARSLSDTNDERSDGLLPGVSPSGLGGYAAGAGGRLRFTERSSTALTAALAMGGSAARGRAPA